MNPRISRLLGAPTRILGGENVLGFRKKKGIRQSKYNIPNAKGNDQIELNPNELKSLNVNRIKVLFCKDSLVQRFNFSFVIEILPNRPL